jgi:hypothetical protein
VLMTQWFTTYRRTASLSPSNMLSPPVSNQSNHGLFMLENQGDKIPNYGPQDTVPHANTLESLHNHTLEKGQNKFWSLIYYCFTSHILFSWSTLQFATLCCYLLLYTIYLFHFLDLLQSELHHYHYSHRAVNMDDLQRAGAGGTTGRTFLNFKLSLYSECCIVSSG